MCLGPFILQCIFESTIISTVHSSLCVVWLGVRGSTTLHRFNVKSDTNVCEIYFYQPSLLGIRLECSYYSVRFTMIYSEPYISVTQSYLETVDFLKTIFVSSYMYPDSPRDLWVRSVFLCFYKKNCWNYQYFVHVGVG